MVMALSGVVIKSELTGPLSGEPLRGQLAEFVVDQRQELLGCLRVAVLDGREDALDVVHRRGLLSPPITPIPAPATGHPTR